MTSALYSTRVSLNIFYAHSTVSVDNIVSINDTIVNSIL